ncbi:MAG: hypothetical protein EZS28_037345 [Streblomastix strix]|uniref:Uncharacterized protein n=1 Tax=Streblomastix strix TaxID=222440 RepID=A0A5J4U965_9EUKA|nr:MAG: hypothetical protein EZS28_037345 [Streblomastix strix]
MEHKSKIFKALTTRIMKDNFQDKQLIEQLDDMLKELIGASQPKGQIHLLYYELTNLSSNFDLMNERLYQFKRQSDIEQYNNKLYNENHYDYIKIYNKCKEEININPKIVKIKQYLLMDLDDIYIDFFTIFALYQMNKDDIYSIKEYLCQILKLIEETQDRFEMTVTLNEINSKLDRMIEQTTDKPSTPVQQPKENSIKYIDETIYSDIEGEPQSRITYAEIQQMRRKQYEKDNKCQSDPSMIILESDLIKEAKYKELMNKK